MHRTTTEVVYLDWEFDEAEEHHRQNGEGGHWRPCAGKRLQCLPHLLLVRLGGGLRKTVSPSLLLVLTGRGRPSSHSPVVVTSSVRSCLPTKRGAAEGEKEPIPVPVAAPFQVLVGEPWMSPSSDHTAAYVRLLEAGWEHVGQEQRMAGWRADR
jgi:hypothetical protein